MDIEFPDTAKKSIIDTELLQKFKEQAETEQQVIVHCCFPCDSFFGSLIRVWPSTFLICKTTNHRSKLIHAENISISPYWTEVEPFQDFWFTLIFSGLPKGCKQFDLKEEIAEEGGFYIPNIKRNNSDVYKVKII